MTPDDLKPPPEPPIGEELTEKQIAFVQEYLLDMCKTKAAIRAGYSRRTATSQGRDNYNKPHVRAAIDVGIEERRVRLAIDADRVVREVAILAFSDIGDVEMEEDTWRPAYVLPETRRAVRKVKLTKRVITRGDYSETIYNTELEFYDKAKALQCLMTHLGMLHAELPPLEVLLNRLPPNLAAVLRKLMANPNIIKQAQEQAALNDQPKPEASHASIDASTDGTTPDVGP